MARKNPLLNETASLVLGIVRDAKRKRPVVGSDGITREEPPDIVERVKAADVALRFMMVKEKIDPHTEESAFERDLADFHDTGESNANSATSGRTPN